MVNGNNNISKKRECTCKRIITSLKGTQGLLTLAAKKAGVSYTTINRYANEFPSVQKAVQEAKESMTDFAEGQLFKKISNGDTACIIFYLKTKGKARGYIERYEHTGGEGERFMPEALNLIFPEGTELIPGRMGGDGHKAVEVDADGDGHKEA